MKIWQKIAGITWTGMMMMTLAMLSIPMKVAAGTPEFARSEEEWARLRDNVIEYEELTDLVHEYNATVKKNRIDLNQFRKDYGDTNEEWADRYRELADDLEASLDYPDIEDLEYSSIMTNIVTSEMQIEAWRETADDALEDYLTYYYDTSLAECILASQAQTYMINWHLGQLQMEHDEKTLALLNEQFRSIQTKQSLGLATEAQVLAMRESVRNAEKAVQDDKDAQQNLYQRMIVMLGWSHDALPEVREIPEVDLERVAAMDPVADKTVAMENSFLMKSDKRKLENAKAQDSRETLQETIAENEQSIGAALVAGHQNVLAAQASYDLNVVLAELERDNLRMANLEYGLGRISRLDLSDQELKTAQAELAEESAKLQWFQSVESYDWLLQGLAGASSS